jgi:multicomponent K+:H+ antiporter subunit D
LAGFLAKFALLAPVLEITPRLAPLVLFTVIIAAGFCTLIAMCRSGIQIFWAEPERHFPRVGIAEVGATVFLLGLGLLLSIATRAPMDYLAATADQLHAPVSYIHEVLPPPQARP